MKWTIAIDSRLETGVVSESMDDNTTNTDEFAALRGAINEALATKAPDATLEASGTPAPPDATLEASGTPAPSEYNYCDLCDRYDSLIERKPWGELCSDCWFYVYDKNDPSEIDDRSESMTYTPTGSYGSYGYAYKAAPLFKQISCVATPPESWDDGESDDDDDEDIGELMPVEILEDMHDMEWATESEDL